MPMYEYECRVCGHVQDAVNSIDERENGPLCDNCEKMIPMKLIISAVRGIVKFPAARGDAYISPVTNRVIDTEYKRRDDLARTNCRPYEGFEQESKQAARFRADADKKADEKLHVSVSKAYHELTPEKQRIIRGAT